MRMATSAAVLASLNEDLALEHGAIIQYAVQGIQLRDSPITAPVRGIAREEMWHFEWIAEAIRDRGGQPSLERAEVFLSTMMGGSMVKDVDTEHLAIEHYNKTLALIGDSDPDLSALLQRIVSDERSHAAEFQQLADVVRAHGEAAFAARPLTEPADIPVIGQTIGMEYTTVLQYLWNQYGCGDCERGDMYFELAVEEMRHLAWAGNYLPGLASPVPPEVPADRVRAIASVEEADRAAAFLEEHAEPFYAEMTAKAKSPALSRDLARARVQHAYHRYRLGAPASYEIFRR
jgi:bacterioferritin